MTERERIMEEYLREKNKSPVEPRIEPEKSASLGMSAGTATAVGGTVAAVAQAANEVLNGVAQAKELKRQRDAEQRMNYMRYQSRLRDAKYGSQRQQGRDNADDYIRTLSSVLRAQPT